MISWFIGQFDSANIQTTIQTATFVERFEGTKMIVSPFSWSVDPTTKPNSPFGAKIKEFAEHWPWEPQIRLVHQKRILIDERCLWSLNKHQESESP
jgi:hypothetical protein